MKTKNMTYETLKEKVTARLIAGGFNENDVFYMMRKYFEYAIEKYATVKEVVYCISALSSYAYL
jgi:hypothetical protein